LHYFVTEVAAQVLGSPEIDLAPEYPAELDLHGGESKKTDPGPIIKIHEDVDVALGTEITAKNRPEKGELPDSVTPAEIGDRLLRYFNSRIHRSIARYFPLGTKKV